MERLHRERRGFTLIELLVVIAIIAILAAGLMPALSSATDRSRTTECRAHLTHLSMALHMYHDDWGRYPVALEPLLKGGYITDDGVLRCTKTGAFYYYTMPAKGAGPETVMSGCVAPTTPAGQRPHGYRNTLMVLSRGRKVRELEAAGR